VCPFGATIKGIRPKKSSGSVIPCQYKLVAYLVLVSKTLLLTVFKAFFSWWLSFWYVVDFQKFQNATVCWCFCLMAKQAERMCPVGKELSGSRYGRFDQHFGRKLLPFLCHVFVIMVHFKYLLFEFRGQGGFVLANLFLKSLFWPKISLHQMLNLGWSQYWASMD
jgi:hypothetical protein